MPRFLPVAALLLLVACSSARAQFRNPPRLPLIVRPAQLQFASNATRTSVERFRQLVQAEQFEEAVDTLMALLEAPPGEVIQIEGDADQFARYVPVRWYCHWLLTQAAFESPETLRRYRSRVDSLARRWVEQGRAGRDETLLLRVVEQMFASSHADQALLTLGELALERGEFQKARGYWQRITPLAMTPSVAGPIAGLQQDRPLFFGVRGASTQELADPVVDWLLRPRREPSTRLIHPDSDIAPADVLARLVIASTLEGVRERAATELVLLRRMFPDAEGRLAGRNGKWSALLAPLVDGSKDWPGLPQPADWPTFAGDRDRTRVARDEPDPAMRPAWSARLRPVRPVDEAFAEGRQRTNEWRDAALAVYPIIRDGRVYCPQPNSILGFDLSTGRPGFGAAFDGRPGVEPAPYEIYRRDFVSTTPKEARVYGAPRYTLASHGDWLFARVGSPHTNWPDPQFEPLKREEWGVIVGLDLSAEGKLLPGFPLAPDDWNWTFDGSPVCDGARIYVAMRRRDPARVQLHVACFEATSGRRLWRTQVASRDHWGDGSAIEISHTLLTLANERVYVNTNMGAVAALNAEDGHLRWVLSYPRSPPQPEDVDKSDRHYFREVNPCVVKHGLVYAAPADCDRIFALEEAEGRLAWTTRPGLGVDANHLIGVAQETLIAGGDSLYWWDAFSGETLCQFPPAAHRGDGFAIPEPRGIGRGVLAGESVFFPTRDAIFVFSQRPIRTPRGWSPQQRRAPIDLVARNVTGGNLVAAGPWLLLAGPEQLTAFSTTAPLAKPPQTVAVER